MAAIAGRRAVSLCAGCGALAMSDDHVPFSEPCFTTGNDVLFVLCMFFSKLSYVLCMYVFSSFVCNVTCCTFSVLYM